MFDVKTLIKWCWDDRYVRGRENSVAVVATVFKEWVVTEHFDLPLPFTIAQWYSFLCLTVLLALSFNDILWMVKKKRFSIQGTWFPCFPHSTLTDTTIYLFVTFQMESECWFFQNVLHEWYKVDWCQAIVAVRLWMWMCGVLRFHFRAIR